MLKPLIRLLKYWNANNGYIYDSYFLEQKLAGISFYFCNNLKDCLFLAVNNLNTQNLPEYKRQKVERAKQIVNNVRQYEQSGLSISAEAELKKLLPAL